MSFSIEYANTILTDMFPNSAFLALFSSSPTEASSGTELAFVDGYTRKQGLILANWWGTASGGQIVNTQTVRFTATDDWLGIDGLGLFDQSSMGVRHFQKKFTETLFVSSGESFNFAIGDIILNVRSYGP